jgi:hypothetical protein
VVLVAYATPFVVKPLNPVDIGNPVAFVNVTLDGVPNAGVTNVGLVANTTAPDPVVLANMVVVTVPVSPVVTNVPVMAGTAIV